MNRCGSHAKTGTLEHNFTSKKLQNPRRPRFRESFDGQTKAAPKQGQLTQGV
jgi:hypothetical protein